MKPCEPNPDNVTKTSKDSPLQQTVPGPLRKSSRMLESCVHAHAQEVTKTVRDIMIMHSSSRASGNSKKKKKKRENEMKEKIKEKKKLEGPC